MSVLIIGETEKAALKAAQERALTKPIPLELLQKAAKSSKQHKGTITLADREEMKANGLPSRPESEHVCLPVGYRVSISYEQQPVGLCMHLSMSTAKRGRMPRPEALDMVLNALGITSPILIHDPWKEEFEPDHYAWNLLVLAGAPEGEQA